VGVILLVTGDAVGGGALENPVGVAVNALDLDVQAGQREVGEVVVEGSFLPVVRVMAGNAVRGGILQVSDGPRVQVTVAAGYLRVPAAEGEGQQIVIEGGAAEMVDAVVAVQAVRTELGQETSHSFDVTVGAVEWSAIRVEGVACQEEANHFVREGGDIHDGEVGVGAPVFRVAVLAPQGCRFLAQYAVQCGGIGELGGDVGVAFQALLAEGGLIPGRRVAETAIAADFGVRRDATQLLAACLGAQRSGREEPAAAQNHKGHDQQQR